MNFGTSVLGEDLYYSPFHKVEHPDYSIGSGLGDFISNSEYIRFEISRRARVPGEFRGVCPGRS